MLNFNNIHIPVPERLLPQPEELTRRHKAAFGGILTEEEITKERDKAKKYYSLIIIAAVLGLILTAAALIQSQTALSSFIRDKQGGAETTQEVDVTGTFGGKSVTKRTTITVRPQAISEKQAKDSLAVLAKKLPEIIKGGNTALTEVTTDLALPESDPKTGADITWSSSDEDTITDEGKLSPLTAEPGEEITLTAQLRLGSAAQTVEIPVKIGENAAANAGEKEIENAVQAAADEFSEQDTGEKAELPGEAEGGVKLSWREPKDLSIALLPLICIAIGVMVYRTRYKTTDKKAEKAREQAGYDFPEFLSKFTLLTGAGLAATSAITKIANDYRERITSQSVTPAPTLVIPAKAGISNRRFLKAEPRQPKTDKTSPNHREQRYFYEELCHMQTRMSGGHTSLTAEFTELAARTGRREIMRFATVLADGIDKGSALAAKLEQESHMLWEAHKARTEERSSIAETKLVFPMSLQLLVTIIITAAPAMLSM
jgi:hypothetical protein